jgi:hypothetical protein
MTRLDEDGSVTSVQTLALPGASLPEGAELDGLLRELARAYASWISRLTAGCVEIVEERDGTSRARVQLFRITGLLLGAPRIQGGRLQREVLSGCLVSARSGSLDIRLAPIEGGVAASVELHGFRSRIAALPWIGPALFTRTQDVLHQRHSRGFLRFEVAPRLARYRPSADGGDRTRARPRTVPAPRLAGGVGA